MNKTKKLIFESAIKVFSRNGYTGATMDQIAANAGVAKGTLYYHFKSKEEIFKYIIKEGMNIIRNSIETITKNETNPINKLRTVCKLQLSLVYENRDFFKVVMSQIWGQELRQHELRDSVKEYIGFIEKSLKEAVNSGFIKDQDTNFMAYTFFGTVCSAVVYELINVDNLDINKVVDKLTHYIFKGIEK